MPKTAKKICTAVVFCPKSALFAFQHQLPDRTLISTYLNLEFLSEGCCCRQAIATPVPASQPEQTNKFG